MRLKNADFLLIFFSSLLFSSGIVIVTDDILTRLGDLRIKKPCFGDTVHTLICLFINVSIMHTPQFTYKVVEAFTDIKLRLLNMTN